MNQKLLFAIAWCLFLFSSIGHAQQPMPPSKWKVNVQFHKTPMAQQIVSESLKKQMREYWNGRTWAMDLTSPEIRAALDISDELHQNIRNAREQIDRAATAVLTGRTTINQEHPELQELLKEKQASDKEMEMVQRSPEFIKFWEEESRKAGQPIKFFFPDLYPDAPLAAKEGFEKSQVIGRKILEWQMKNEHDAVFNVLPPELKQRINETLLANMADLPIVSPNMFEALNLTNAQKEQMEEIRKEHEPEFERNLEKLVSGQMFIMNKILDELDQQEDGSEDTFWEQMGIVQKRMLAEDPECKEIYEEIRSQGQSFAAKYKEKMFDVLTDEQWVRLLNLIDDPPEHAQAVRKLTKLVAEKSSSGWQSPSDKPWRMDNAIPQEYRLRRNGR